MALISNCFKRLLGSQLESVDPKWRSLHTTAVRHRVQAGRYRRTPKCDRPLTYEMANPPYYIAHRKAWNSWNTSSLLGGLRPAETTIEDLFIRRFMMGTWHNLFLSEVIIKRQHNLIRIAGLIKQTISARKMYFLVGYTEEMLANWLQCPIQLELQSVADPKAVIFQMPPPHPKDVDHYQIYFKMGTLSWKAHFVSLKIYETSVESAQVQQDL